MFLNLHLNLGLYYKKEIIECKLFPHYGCRDVFDNIKFDISQSGLYALYIVRLDKIKQNNIR